MNLINKIEILSRDLAEAKKEMSQVIVKIKLEKADQYFKYETQPFTNFRFAYALLTGNLLDKYSYYSNSVKIEPAKDWDTKKYLNYYNIIKATEYRRFNEVIASNVFGFICLKKDFVQAIQYELNDIWKFQVKNGSCESSRKEYIDYFTKESSDSQIEIYEDYLNRNNIKYLNFVEINNKSLGLKNIIIFEKQ